MSDDSIQAEAEEMAETLAYRAATRAVEFIGTGEHRVKDLVSYLKPQFAIALRRQREEACPNSDDHHEHSVMWEALERLGASFDMGLSDHGASGIVKRALGEYQRGREDGAREEREAADDLLMAAWGVIANAGGGNWTLEKPDWRAAAADWRDRWHRRLREAE